MKQVLKGCSLLYGGGFESYLPNLLIGRYVNVYFEDVHVGGLLVGIERSVRSNHRPEVLILEAPEGKIVVRAWSKISLVKR
jgi:hypothetical protein